MEDVGYGDGTITRRSDGRIQVMVHVGGKRRYAMIPKNLPEKEQLRRAEKKRQELLGHRAADLDPSAQTVADYLRSWISGLASAKRQRVRPRTLDGYSMIVERHLVPSLGHHRLDRLSERHVQAWVDANPAKPRTIDRQRATLRRALNVAVRQRILPRNPALAVELPEPDEFQGDPLTFDEARRLLEATADDRLHALWRVAIASALRQGELLALARDDFDGNMIRVEHQLQRRGGSWVFGPTKAARTLKQVALDPDTAEALERHKVQMAGERDASWRYFGLMFVTPDGEPYHQTAVLRAFHRACDRAGIRRRRFHDLRATSLTLMREIGVPEDVRMARAGHSTTDMARHYAQARPGLDQEAVNALGMALRRAQ